MDGIIVVQTRDGVIMAGCHCRAFIIKTVFFITHCVFYTSNNTAYRVECTLKGVLTGSEEENYFILFQLEILGIGYISVVLLYSSLKWKHLLLKLESRTHCVAIIIYKVLNIEYPSIWTSWAIPWGVTNTNNIIWKNANANDIHSVIWDRSVLLLMKLHSPSNDKESFIHSWNEYIHLTRAVQSQCPL